MRIASLTIVSAVWLGCGCSSESQGTSLAGSGQQQGDLDGGATSHDVHVADHLGDQAATPTTETLARQWAEAICERNYACTPATMSYFYSDLSGCVAEWQHKMHGNLTSPGLSLDLDAYRACVANISKQTCLEVLAGSIDPAECLPEIGTLATGAACEQGHDCQTGACFRLMEKVGDGVGALALCGECVVPAGEGEQCGRVGGAEGLQFVAACAPGFVCDDDENEPGKLVCLRALKSEEPVPGHAALGEACSKAQDCRQELDRVVYCIEHRCAHSDPKVGDPCSGDGLFTAPTCDGDRTGLECFQDCDYGEFVNRYTNEDGDIDFEGLDAAYQQCVDTKPRSCQPSIFVTVGVGESCGLLDENSEEYVECGGGLYCQMTTGEVGKCINRSDLGDACDGVATPMGSPCRFDYQCIKGTCQERPGRCGQ